MLKPVRPFHCLSLTQHYILSHFSHSQYVLVFDSLPGHTEEHPILVRKRAPELWPRQDLTNVPAEHRCDAWTARRQHESCHCSVHQLHNFINCLLGTPQTCHDHDHQKHIHTIKLYSSGEKQPRKHFFLSFLTINLKDIRISVNTNNLRCSQVYNHKHG